MTSRSEAGQFRRCGQCDKVWHDRSEFLLDGNLFLNGYQVNFDDLELGWLLFTHLLPDCNGTIAVPVHQFTDLYEGAIHTERKTDTEECPGHCQDADNLSPCKNQCECAFVREILQVIKERKYYLLTD